MIFFKKDSYQLVAPSKLGILKKTYSDVWKDETFPEKQWRRVEKQLQNINNSPEFQSIITCIKATKLKNPSILEIGCSSGYLSEVLKKSKIKGRYEGTDYSPAFINFAKEKYPKISFSVNDATNLGYKKNSFDIVISGCCLLHIVDYQKAISEATRIAKKFVIFHRTPVFHLQPTTFFTKTAYGATMLEIVFNEEELINHFWRNKLTVIKAVTISVSEIYNANEKVFFKNYLCLRRDK